MSEHEREGVIVDTCRSCRGVWLDRGELEKILSFAVREAEEQERWGLPRDARRRGHYGDEPKNRQGSWARTLKDIFD